jgi:stage IV sporulation protein FB
MDNIPSTETGGQEPVAAFPPKPETTSLTKPYLVTQFLLTLLAFGLAWYFLINKNFELIVWLVVILIIHELGHFLAMKIFKYEDLAIFFIPLVGAAAQGSKEKISQREKAIVLLAGPVPGIIIGIILYLAGRPDYTNLDFEELLNPTFPPWLPYAFVLVNIFNLLPIYPLDGGQLFRNLFLPDRDVVSIIFTLLSMVLISWYAIDHENWYLLLIPFSLLARLVQQGAVNKMRGRLDELQIDFRKSYSELSDEHYWRIRDEMREHQFYAKLVAEADANPEKKEKQVMNHIRQVLKPEPINDLSASGKLAIMIVWIGAVALPFILMDRIWNIL